MDTDFKDIVAAAQAILRSVGAEVASPWFYLQFGLILAGAGIAFAANAAICARVDMNSLATRWPLPVMRHFMRVLVGSAATAVFAILMIVSFVFLFVAYRFSLRISSLKDANIALAQRVGILEYHVRSISHEQETAAR